MIGATFVLVLALNAEGTRFNFVPGYATTAACEQAGRDWLKLRGKLFACVPERGLGKPQHPQQT